jgi:hypothetical protein
VNARATDPGATNNQQPDSTAAAQATIDQFLEAESARARSAGQDRARVGDPDGFEGAQGAILAAIDEYGTASADDVVWPVRGNELGAAFSALRKAGRIEAAGYAVSRRPQAHGRLLRVWRRP